MTARELYKSVLVELNKVKAPAIMLDDFNYVANKSFYQYLNKRYTIYNTSQQTTDDLRVLRASVKVDKFETNDSLTGAYSGIYKFYLPTDYYHILNCIIEFVPVGSDRCKNSKGSLFKNAKKLTSDMWGTVLSNYYNRPSFKNPYYIIHNGFNQNDVTPYNPFVDNGKLGVGNDYAGNFNPINIDPYDKESVETGIQQMTIENFARQMDGVRVDENGVVIPTTIDTVNRMSAVRYGNAQSIPIEIRVGDDDSSILKSVYIDYLKVPQNINLTSEQLDVLEDTSQIIEFPDYVCYEIINELTHVLMENASDPRIQTHIPVNTSIVTAAQTVQNQVNS